jgi:hypothetical protein
LGDGAGTICVPASGGIADAKADADAPAIGDSCSAEPEPPRNQRNYRISDADRLGVGSLKRKCQANLAAIAMLKTLEAEGRPATEDEKRALVRYVGWGGLPQVFDA